MKITGYVLTILGTIIGGFTFFDTLISADTIPQQQAGVIIALAWAILPYCFARAVEKIGERSMSEVLDRYFRRLPIEPEQAPTKQIHGVNLGPSQTPRAH